jgi:hypothetical protein
MREDAPRRVTPVVPACTFVSLPDARGAYASAIATFRRLSLLRRVRRVSGFALGAALTLASRSVFAGPGDAEASKGITLATRGDCVQAIPLLEQAERIRHRPASAVALGDCYVQVSEMLRASEIYNRVSRETPDRDWSKVDVSAWKLTKKKALEVDARIPTLRFAPDEPYEDLAIEVAGREVKDPRLPTQVPPDVSLVIVVRAKGYKPYTEKIVLNEGERRKMAVRLDLEVTGALKGPGTPGSGPYEGLGPGPGAGSSSEPPPTTPGSGPPTTPGPVRAASTGTWIGVRYQGAIIPAFVFHIFAEGAGSVVVPGVGVTLTMPAGEAEMVISAGYLNYAMGDTPFKPRGGPDTDWEIVSSSLSALNATVDLRWSIPLDAAGKWTFKLGGGVGVGWAFAGDIHRVQAYPKDGKPGDPYTYRKCKGPNNPPGTFRYCNTQDRDAMLYSDYVEPSWFEKGYRPSIFPWLVLPEIGLSWKVAPRVIVDLGAGASLTGIVTDLGVRFSL